MRRIIDACLLLCAMTVVGAAPAVAQTTSTNVVKEMLVVWQRSVTEILDIAEAMPEDKYNFKPTPEVHTFREQLVHLAGIAERYVDTAKGTKSAAHDHGKSMPKAEVIALVKSKFQAAEAMLAATSDAQLLEQVKFPFGDRMVSRFVFWTGPILQVRNHHGQLVVYLRLNGIVPPTTARRGR
jgi:uncharacterized damage-inducible protein DinB